MRLIDTERPQGSKKNAVTIVFDGKDDCFFEKSKYSTDVIFSKRETADDLIKRLVKRSHNPKGIILVSDDRELGFSVRMQGAKILKVADFLSKITSRRRQQKKIRMEERKEISQTDKSVINEELKKVWIK